MLRFLLIMLLAGLAVPLSPAIASATGACCCFCRAGRCSVKVDEQEVEDTVFDVECETICIPPIRFPWECGPLRKCGQVRVINKLVTEKEKRKECTYDWSAIVCCPRCRHRITCPRGNAAPIAGSESVCKSTRDLSSTLVEDGFDAAALPIDRNKALQMAIACSTPDTDGWVAIEKPSGTELIANSGLIDTEVEIIDSHARRKQD